MNAVQRAGRCVVSGLLCLLIPVVAQPRDRATQSWADRAADALWNAVPATQREFLERHRPEARQWLSDQSFLRILFRQEVVISDAFLTATFRHNSTDTSLRDQAVHVRSDGIVEIRGRKKVFIFKPKFFFHLRLQGYRFDPQSRVFRLTIVESKPEDYDPVKEGTFDGLDFVDYKSDGRQISVNLDKLKEAPGWFQSGWVRLLSIQEVRLLDGELRVRFDLKKIDEYYGLSTMARQVVAGIMEGVQELSR